MTAVEKLEISLLGLISFDSEELRARYKEAIKQTKEMEEQQIKTAYGSGIETMRKSFSMSSHIPKGAQEYYNDTFNK